MVSDNNKGAVEYPKKQDADRVAQKGKDRIRFIANISHDVRTPLNAIIGMNAIAKSHLNDPDRVASCLEKIDIASKHLMSLLNDILDYNNIADGLEEVRPEVIRMLVLGKETIPDLRKMAEAKNQILTVDASGVRDDSVFADRAILSKIVTGIAENAIKYTPQGGNILLRFEEVWCDEKYAEYTFLCEDDGIGMEEDYLEHIFEPFVKPEDARIRNVQGNGFGLAIISHLVEMMGGSISVESSYGKGTKVLVSMKLERVDAGENIEGKLRNNKILILSDDERYVDILADTLRDAGLTVCITASASEATDEILRSRSEGQEYAAILLNGEIRGGCIEAAKAVRREIGFRLPMILAESFRGEVSEQEARTVGITKRLPKPVYKGELMEVLREIQKESYGQPVQTSKPQSGAFFEEELDFTGKRILLVEDNELNAELAMEIFETTGADIEWVRNGKEAVNQISSSSEDFYDIIFMDIQMPIMNGYEATMAIRELPRSDVSRLPIIALTANAFSSDARQARHSGMNEHLTKPIDPAVLEKVMKKYLMD